MKRLIFITSILMSFLISCAFSEQYAQITLSSYKIQPTSTSTIPDPDPVEPISVRDASISAVANQAQARSTENEQFVTAQEGMIIFVGGGVQTFQGGRASLNLRPEGTIIRVGPNTIFTLQTLMTEDNGPLTRIKLDFGQIWILLNGGSLEVETPSGVASVRGSLLGVSYDPADEHMEAHCLEGDCTLENDFGGVKFTNGQESNINGDKGPSNVEDMDKSEIQAWVNENPDAWEYFDGEDIPDWMPEPDFDWLDGEREYFKHMVNHHDCTDTDGHIDSYDCPNEYGNYDDYNCDEFGNCFNDDGHIHDDSHRHPHVRYCEKDDDCGGDDGHIHDKSHPHDPICDENDDCFYDDDHIHDKSHPHDPICDATRCGDYDDHIHDKSHTHDPDCDEYDGCDDYDDDGSNSSGSGGTTYYEGESSLYVIIREPNLA